MRKLILISLCLAGLAAPAGAVDLWLDVDAALAEAPVNLMPLIDDTDFKTRVDDIAYDDVTELIWHFTTTTGATSATVVTPTTGGDYDWAHQDGGLYTIEIPDTGGASINNDTEGFGWFTGLATGVLPWRGPVIGFRAAGLNNTLIDSAHSATRGLAGTALPDAAADAAGGLPISDTGALDLDLYLRSGVTLAGTANAGDTTVKITLTGGVAADNYYNGQLVVLTGGTGIGQSRTILNYLAAGTVATPTRDWAVAPDDTTTFVVIGADVPSILEAGVATAGADATITLDATASTTADIYKNNFICISGGTGAGQTRLIGAYSVGRVATVLPNWTTNPDATSIYQILPMARVDVQGWVGHVVTGDGDWAALKAETAAILADTGELQTNQGAWATATGFSTHTAANVWEAGTRTLTALDEDDTTIDLDGSTFDPNTTPVQVSTTGVSAIQAGLSVFDPNATPVTTNTTSVAAIQSGRFDPNTTPVQISSTAVAAAQAGLSTFDPNATPVTTNSTSISAIASATQTGLSTFDAGSDKVYLADGAHGGSSATLTLKSATISNSEGPGVSITGTTDGLYAEGTAGSGLHGVSSGSNGSGAEFDGNGTGDGINAASGASSSAAGIQVTSASGDGITISAAGDGITVAGGTGPALQLSSTSDSALEATAGTNKHGFELKGNGSGKDLYLTDYSDFTGSTFDPNTTPVQVSTTGVAAVQAGLSTFDPNATPVTANSTTVAAVQSGLSTFDPNSTPVTTNSTSIAAIAAAVPSSSFDPNTTPVQLSSTALSAVAAGLHDFDPNTTPIQVSSTGVAALAAALHDFDPNSLPVQISSTALAAIAALLPANFDTVTVADAKIAADASVSLTEEDVNDIAAGVLTALGEGITVNEFTQPALAQFVTDDTGETQVTLNSVAYLSRYQGVSPVIFQ